MEYAARARLVLPPRRVLFVQPFTWRTGPERTLLHLVTHLDERHYAPLVALANGGEAQATLAAYGVPLKVIRSISLLPRSHSPAKLSAYATRAVVTAVRLARVAQRQGALLLHTNGEACWAGPLAARLARVPSVVQVHGMSFARPRAVALVTGMVLNALADVVVACSPSVGRALRGAGVSPAKIRVVDNGVDLDRFQPGRGGAERRREFSVAAVALCVGAVGGLDPRKGHDVLMEAAARVVADVPGTRVFFVGGDVPRRDGPASAYREALRRRARELGLEGNVVFTGQRDDVPELLDMFDVVVQPSLTEAGPLVPLEAMAMAKPVVATDVGGNADEVVHGETGLLVPPSDPGALADAILTLARDADLRRRFGIAGRRRVEAHYSTRRVAEEMQRIYDELLAKGRVSPQRHGDTEIEGV